MLLRIPNLIGAGELGEISRIMQSAQFVDGKLTAGGAARQVKHNTELSANSDAVQRINTIIRRNLDTNPVFQHGAMPHAIGTPIYAQYQQGMSYGDHIDAPFMGTQVRYRSDISITVFLSAPEDYDGGELVINTTFGEQRVKLPMGDAVIYPSSSLHHVDEVTRGVRTVAVTWIQSLVKEPEKRQLLYNLYETKEQIATVCHDADRINQLTNIYVNLLRMWSDT